MCTLPMFPVLHQQGWDLSVAISIYRVQSFCPQLLIASAFPCISLDDFCLVCNWIQVLPQHTESSLCPVALALSRALQQPYHRWFQCPSWHSPFWFGNSAVSGMQLLVIVLLTCAHGAVLCLSLEGKLLKEVPSVDTTFLSVVQGWSLMVDVYCVQRLFRVTFLSWKEWCFW